MQVSKLFEKETRMVLIGKTGAGKSATGNSILGVDIFDSGPSAASMTTECKRSVVQQNGMQIVVVDTPGIFDTGKSNHDVTKEIVKCVAMTSPGPHVIILVISIGRFTEEEEDTVKHFVEYFGEKVYKFMIVVFTKKDELFRSGKSIKTYLNESDKLNAIIKECGDRVVTFNNHAIGIEMKEQILDLLDTVKTLCCDNNGKCYTNEMFKEVDKAIKRVMDMTKNNRHKVIEIDQDSIYQYYLVQLQNKKKRE